MGNYYQNIWEVAHPCHIKAYDVLLSLDVHSDQSYWNDHHTPTDQYFIKLPVYQLTCYFVVRNSTELCEKIAL